MVSIVVKCTFTLCGSDPRLYHQIAPSVILYFKLNVIFQLNVEMFFLCTTAGDQCHRSGLPVAAANGLSECTASADARLLAERAQQSTQIQPDSQHPGQDNPQPHQPEGDHATIIQVQSS